MSRSHGGSNVGAVLAWPSLVPSPPPQLSSLAQRVIRTASDDCCGGGLGTRLGLAQYSLVYWQWPRTKDLGEGGRERVGRERVRRERVGRGGFAQSSCRYHFTCSIHETYLPGKKAGLAVMQSYPLRRTRFSQLIMFLVRINRTT